MTSISDLISKGKRATSSIKNLINLEIPSYCYQIYENDSASAEIIGITGAQIREFLKIPMSYYHIDESDSVSDKIIGIIRA